MVSTSSKGREEMLGHPSTSSKLEFKRREEMLPSTKSEGREEMFKLPSGSSDLLEIHIVSDLSLRHECSTNNVPK